MRTLTPIEARALGAIIEKAMTVPGQYPMSLNGMTAACNQKNAREPVMTVSDEEVFDAVDGLRQKGLVREVVLTGSRVEKYRHVAKEALSLDTREMVVLAELLLRGPQTVGELRGRASRMTPLESTEIVEQIVRTLMEREEPLVRELPPAPGSRAKRYAQLLSPDAHSLDAPPAVAAPSPAHSDLGERVERLEAEVAQLRERVDRLSAALE
jgi:uncharacterized protein